MPSVQKFTNKSKLMGGWSENEGIDFTDGNMFYKIVDIPPDNPVTRWLKSYRLWLGIHRKYGITFVGNANECQVALLPKRLFEQEWTEVRS